MKQQHIDYQVVPYPKMRRWMAPSFRSVQHKPMIHSLFEVDVTRARAHELIKGSELYSMQECRHWAPGEKPEEFSRVVLEFLNRYSDVGNVSKG